MLTFKQIFVIQCRSTGRFLTEGGNSTKSLNKAGHCFDKDSATDTAIYELDYDFEIYSFYQPIVELGANHEFH